MIKKMFYAKTEDSNILANKRENGDNNPFQRQMTRSKYLNFKNMPEQLRETSFLEDN